MAMDDASSALIAQLLQEDNEYALNAMAGFMESSESEEDDGAYVGNRRKRKKKAGAGRGRGGKRRTVDEDYEQANGSNAEDEDDEFMSDDSSGRPARRSRGRRRSSTAGKKEGDRKRATPRRWTTSEERLFEEALQLYGRDWKQCAAHLNSGRKPRDIASHAQKYFIKLYKDDRPLPDKVRESGEGYTLSGKPLDPNSAAARAYGVHGSRGQRAYRTEVAKAKRTAAAAKLKADLDVAPQQPEASAHGENESHSQQSEAAAPGEAPLDAYDGDYANSKNTEQSQYAARPAAGSSSGPAAPPAGRSAPVSGPAERPVSELTILPTATDDDLRHPGDYPAAPFPDDDEDLGAEASYGAEATTMQDSYHSHHHPSHLHHLHHSHQVQHTLHAHHPHHHAGYSHDASDIGAEAAMPAQRERTSLEIPHLATSLHMQNHEHNPNLGTHSERQKEQDQGGLVSPFPTEASGAQTALASAISGGGGGSSNSSGGQPDMSEPEEAADPADVGDQQTASQVPYVEGLPEGFDIMDENADMTTLSARQRNDVLLARMKAKGIKLGQKTDPSVTYRGGGRRDANEEDDGSEDDGESKGHSSSSTPSAAEERKLRAEQKKQDAWEKQQAKQQQMYGSDGRTEYSRNRSRRRTATRFIQAPSEALEFVPFSQYVGPPASGPRSQPFRVTVHSSVYATVDLHAHLSTSEVMGFLAGTFDAAKLTIEIKGAYPGRSMIDGATECEMDPMTEVALRDNINNDGLTVVGWYHSHPTFEPVPSQCDVANQANYQALFRDGPSNLEPFLGLIISPYDMRLPQSNRSQFSWFYVESPTLTKTAKRVEADLVCDEVLPPEARKRMLTLVSEKDRSSAAAVDFTKTWRSLPGQEACTYADKVRRSLAFWFPPLVQGLLSDEARRATPAAEAKQDQGRQKEGNGAAEKEEEEERKEDEREQAPEPQESEQSSAPESNSAVPRRMPARAAARAKARAEAEAKAKADQDEEAARAKVNVEPEISRTTTPATALSALNSPAQTILDDLLGGLLTKA